MNIVPMLEKIFLKEPWFSSAIIVNIENSKAGFDLTKEDCKTLAFVVDQLNAKIFGCNCWIEQIEFFKDIYRPYKIWTLQDKIEHCSTKTSWKIVKSSMFEKNTIHLTKEECTEFLYMIEQLCIFIACATKWCFANQ